MRAKMNLPEIQTEQEETGRRINTKTSVVIIMQERTRMKKSMQNRARNHQPEDIN